MGKKFLLLGLISLGILLSACNGNEASEGKPDTAPSSSVSQVTLVPNPSLSNQSSAITLEPQTLQPGEGTLVVNITMPYRYKFNNIAPFAGNFTVIGDNIQLDEKWANYKEVEPEMPLLIPLSLHEGESVVVMDLSIYWCEAIQQSLCFVEQREINAVIVVDPQSNNQTATVDVALVPPS